MDSLDGIIRRPVCPTRHLHYGIRRFFGTLPSRGFTNDAMTVLFVYDEKEPCNSRILKEVHDNRITNPETARRLALMYIRRHRDQED
jgi:hypothetical protein